MRTWIAACSVAVLLLSMTGTAMATPSKIIWIPSTDIQPFMVGHIDIDNYVRGAGNSAQGRDPNIMDLGFELGVLPFEKVQLELGFDFLAMAVDPNDQHPWSGNAKLATPQSSMFDNSPAIAVGVYNGRPVKDVLVRDAPKVYSGQNIVYGLVSETIPDLGAVPSLGRFSAGYYRGSKRALVDNDNLAVARTENSGLLLSWDRTMRELSDRLWIGIDYMGGKNIDGSVNFGVAWKFARNVSVTLGYDVYTKKSVAGENTFTTQVDINFP